MLNNGIVFILSEKDLFLSLSAIALSASALYLMFADGIRLRQCGVLTGLFAPHLDSIAVAVSRIAYRTGSNYLGLTVVRRALADGGLRSSPPATGVDRQPDQINKLLQTVSKLPWPMVLSSGSFVPVFDLGYVDYATIAFRLFGLRIEALYYLYFTLLGVSCALFCWVNFDNPAALWSIGLMLLSLRWLKLYTTMFDESDMNYVYAHHFLSTLTLVPAFHIALGLLSAQPLSWPAIAACTIQCCILWLSLLIRYGASWVLFAIAAAALSSVIFDVDRFATLLRGFVGVGQWLSHVPDVSGSAVLGDLAAGARGFWLVGVLALCFALLNWRYRRRLSPVFATDEVMDTYPRYHGAYLGLTMDRVTWQRNMRSGQMAQPADLNGVHAVKYWLPSQPGATALYQDMQPELREFHSHKWVFKWRSYERLVRLVFFDYVRKNLRSLAGLYLFYKPFSLLVGLAEALRAVLRGLRRERPIESALLATIASLLAAIAYAGDGSAPVAGALLWFMLAAPAPQIWAYTIRHGIADQAWVAFFAPWALLLWAIANGLKVLTSS